MGFGSDCGTDFHGALLDDDYLLECLLALQFPTSKELDANRSVEDANQWSVDADQWRVDEFPTSEELDADHFVDANQSVEEKNQASKTVILF